MKFSPLLDKVISNLQYLPGIGAKTAERLCFYLLERNRQSALNLVAILSEALDKIRRCKLCRTLCEAEICGICSNHKRDPSVLCVVESPAHLLAIERTHSFQGLYFVLMGHLSPLDSIGPDAIGEADFCLRLETGDIKEIIMATNSTVEGEATAYFFAEIAKKYKILTTRLAHGLPCGGDLEYLDTSTITSAMSNRISMAIT